MKSDVYLERYKHLQFRHSLGYIACLVSLVIFSFYPAFDNDFVNWDDHEYITENPMVLHPTSENLHQLSKSVISLNYHPLTMASLWLNARISGVESAFPFIATNVFIHLLNTLLVFFLVRKLVPDKISIALITSIIFGIHPMHVESVAWISERKDVLYGFFFILSMLCYIKYVEKGKSSSYLFAFLAFVIGCGAKAMTVSLVPVLYLLDIYKERSLKTAKVHFEKIPFIAIALLVGLVAVNVQGGGDFYGYLNRTSDAAALVKSVQFPFYEKMAIACYGLLFYIEKFLFPFNLAPLHPYYAAMEQWYFLGLPLLGVLFLGGLIYGYLKFPKIAFGLAFYLATIVMVLQLIPVGSAIVSERYAYLPYIGLGMTFAFCFEKLLNKIPAGMRWLPIVLMSIYFSWLTRAQVDIWQSTNTLFTRAVEVYPENPQAREFLATGYWLEGNLDNAIQHLEYAINELKFHSTDTYGQLGLCWDNKNDIEKANYFYSKAIELDPKNFASRFNRALLLLNEDPEQALADLKYCEASKNMDITIQLPELKATCYGLLGRYEQSIEQFNKAILISRDQSVMYFNRGVTYEKMGLHEKALLDYQKTIQLDPSHKLANQRIELLTVLNNNKGT